MSVAPALALAAFAELLHVSEGLTGFPGPGTWLIFGVILFPIYVMVVAWFAGTPRQTTPATLGVVYLVGIATSMWVGMLILTLLIGVVFY